MGAVNDKLGVHDAPKPLSMMQCLVQVVKNNVMSANLLKAVGLTNVGSVMSSIQNDPLLKTQADDPQPLLNNDAVIYP